AARTHRRGAAPPRGCSAGTGARERSPSGPASRDMRVRSRPPSWRGLPDLLQRPAAVEQDRPGRLAGREDEEADGVVQRVQEPPARSVGEREAEVEAPVGERQPSEAVGQIALAAAVPAELRRVLSRSAEDKAAVVAQLERDPRRCDARVGGDTQPDGDRLARRKLRPRLTVVVDQLRRDDARLAAPPLAQAGDELVRVDVGGEQPAVFGDRLRRRPVECDFTLAQQNRAIAETLDRLRVVRDEHDRPTALLELRDLAEALALKLLVADREHLVE